MMSLRRYLALCVFTAGSAGAWCVHAQTDLRKLESAYIFNFTQFTQWPADRTHHAELRVCASARSPLREALAALNGRAVGARVWRFTSLADKTLADCDVLAIASNDETSGAMRDAFASDDALLIVAGVGAITPGDAVIALVAEDDHLRFEINNGEAVRRKLVLSSKLLRLARRLK
ncbi:MULTISPECIES: YfiR family protein [unclassified Caballeronia]|uniref:YfiR family protein n=1 Tax=unclassified Caballeronia TaxID=2646786 RepID=UPI00285749B2|nr:MULTISPECIES: YfiR family protein [unclassified Caballeronia]MDR5740522.1 YfiR family protein [Caballeronia sp. LZ016]MDR5808958.1 YfiR family protein [Caballeronia sp. LZ019]